MNSISEYSIVFHREIPFAMMVTDVTPDGVKAKCEWKVSEGGQVLQKENGEFPVEELSKSPWPGQLLKH